MTHRLRAVAIAVLGAFLPASLPVSSQAAEGAMSHYLPGIAGDLGFALKPGSGFQAVNMVWHQKGNVKRAVIQGRVDFGLDLDVTVNMIGGFYTFETPVWGDVSYTVGALVPFGHAKLKASATGPQGNRTSRKATSFAMADMGIVPLQLNYSRGNFHFKAAETVIAPTGNYDSGRFLNMGRNYWSFDTTVAITWMNAETGTEFSAQPGIMFNTKNNDTNYKTGTEFHVDAAINQFVSKTLAFGVHGYHYNQISDDSGSGAKLGDFQSRSTGVGPGFVWSPAKAKGALAIAGKWMWDVSSKRRFDSSYGTLTVGWKF